jgi:hypothetical protein
VATFLGPWEITADAARKLNLERHVLEIREEIPKGERDLPSSWYKRALLSFQLHEFRPWTESWGSIMAEPSWLNWLSPAMGMWITEIPFGAPRPRRIDKLLTDQDLRSIEFLAERLPDVGEPRNHQERTLRRFGLGAIRGLDSDSLIDHVVALEGVLLPGVRDELSYRFRLSGALFLGETQEERRNLFSQLRDCYDIRSYLAHGSHDKKRRPPSEERIRETAELAWSLCAGSLRKAILYGWPTIEGLTDAAIGEPSFST